MKENPLIICQTESNPEIKTHKNSICKTNQTQKLHQKNSKNKNKKIKRKKSERVRRIYLCLLLESMN
jgi:hypothetical protein